MSKRFESVNKDLFSYIEDNRSGLLYTTNHNDMNDLAKLLNEQAQQIASLEAKLAESEVDKNALICDYESRITKEQELMSWLEHKNEQLKQQLAEKEKKFQKWINGYFASQTNQPVLTTSQHITQDKIDFAIEQLEQVKQWCSKYEEDLIDRDDGLVTKVIGLDDAIYSAEVGLYDFIDNQIKELRGQK